MNIEVSCVLDEKKPKPIKDETFARGKRGVRYDDVKGLKFGCENVVCMLMSLIK